MDPISIALSLAEFVPSLIGWFTGDDKDAEKAKKVIAIAKSVTGMDTDGGALASLRGNPELALQLKTSVMQHQIAMAREESRQIESVNKTMRAEGKSEHWMQWSWRPFNGYLFGITLFLNYVIPSLANIILHTFHITDKILEGSMYLEAVRTVPIGVIPEFVLISWGAVLGVTSWQRGKEKLAGIAGKLV